MKVCMIYYSYLEPLLIRDSNSHLDRGDEVDIICYGLANQEKGVSNGRLTIHRLIKRNFNERSPLSYLLKVGHFFLLAFIKVSLLHLRKRFDLIHIFSPPDFMLFSAIVPKLLGAKLILNIRDIVPEFYMRKFRVLEGHIIIRLLRNIERACCHLADHVLTVTDIWKAKLIQRVGIRESECTVIMNVPDDRIIRLARDKEKEKSAEFRLLYPGNLGEHFGVETLIRSIPLVQENIHLVRLDVYGDGPQKEYLMNLSRDLNVDKIIIFHKFIPLEELIPVMRQVDIGIVPTLGGVFAGEALSGKSLEFLALEIPVIIARTTASEYYYDDSMVLFYEPGNHQDLALRIIDLYRAPEKREKLVLGAKGFSAKHNWESEREVYYGVLENLFYGKEM